MTGKLYIVATPIGNLKDITIRALEVLKSVDLIACEDTRHSLKLLNEYGIQKPLVSFHEHNENKRAMELAERIRSGDNVALISDAGTPLISDPGFPLVRTLVEEGLAVEAVPGPCAAVNALVQSAMPPNRFCFVGFLPPKSAARKRKFQELTDLPFTLIFYESTHRIRKFLREAYEVMGPRHAVVVREMTKLHEETLRGPLGQLGDSLQPRSWKGEFVVIIEGKNTI
jgi:16S rRNA (cytidine1402-2'-O)-methyltransferase